MGRDVFAQDSQRFVGCQRVGDVLEVDAGDDLLGRHIGQQLPQRLALDLGVEIPDGVDQGGRGQVDNALFRAEPAELRVAGQFAGECGKVLGDAAQRTAFDEAKEVFERGDAQLGPATERERQAVALEFRICRQDAVGGGVVGILIYSVGADRETGRREAQVDGASAGDGDLGQQV